MRMVGVSLASVVITVSLITGTVGSPRPPRHDSLVLSSTAGAAEYRGHYLGEFTLQGRHGGADYYQQKHSVSGGKGVFLYYRSSDRAWYVGQVLGGSIANLRVPATDPRKGVPTRGWQYSQGAEWGSDPSLEVTPGPPAEPCHSIIIEGGPAATRAVGEALGVYRPTQDFSAGHRIYRKENSSYLLLIKQGQTQWSVRTSLESETKPKTPAEKYGYIVSGRGTLGPESPFAGPSERHGWKGWRYWKDGRVQDWRVLVQDDQEITVTCQLAGCVESPGVYICAGDNVKEFPAKSKQECAKACWDSPLCRFWTLRTTDNYCWLKLSDKCKGGPDDSWTTGTKACGKPGDCTDPEAIHGSIGFAIDNTGSESSSSTSVMALSNGLVDQLLTFNRTHPKWVLVTFNDHVPFTTSSPPSAADIALNTDLRIVTTDVSQFHLSLNSISFGGGADTPERLTQGLKVTLDNLPKHGVALVFTDSPSKDLDMVDSLIQLRDEKEIKIFIVLAPQYYGTVGDASWEVYTKLAEDRIYNMVDFNATTFLAEVVQFVGDNCEGVSLAEEMAG